MPKRVLCPHNDVRYCEAERGAIACFVCGRLFGHLHPDGLFVAFNPPCTDRFSPFSDAELTLLWEGLTTDDGISYGIEEDDEPLYSLASALLAEAKRRGIPKPHDRWDAVV